MKTHWSDEEIASEIARLMLEKGYSESLATALVIVHGMEPLLELIKDRLDIEAEVSSYRESRYKVKREARESGYLGVIL